MIRRARDLDKLVTFVGVAFAWWGCAAGAPATSSPAPAPVGTERAARQDGPCASCHAEIAAEWRGSLHRASHDDPSYLASLAGEPRAFCNGCHAPERDPSAGVSCTTCHGTPHGGDALAVATAPATTRGCGSCHEFAFPSGRELMQKTVSEHRASAHAAARCEDCHMPAVGDGPRRHRSHAFGASRDPAMIRRSLEVAAHALGPGTIEVVLRTAHVGHAVPTGDMFRRLVVRAEAVDALGHVVGRAERRIGRRFERHGKDYVEIDDDRPGGPLGREVRVPLDLGERALGARIRYRVDHERVTNAFVAPERVEAAIVVAQGELREP